MGHGGEYVFSERELVVGDVAREHGVVCDGGSPWHFIEQLAGGLDAAVAHVVADGYVPFYYVSGVGLFHSFSLSLLFVWGI